MRDIILTKAGNEPSLGLQGAVLAAEVGTQRVHPAIVPGDSLGVLCLIIVACRYRIQALYLPVLFEGGAVLVPENGYALVDLPLVEHRPQRELPPVRIQQRLVLDREQPRSFVRMQV